LKIYVFESNNVTTDVRSTIFSKDGKHPSLTLGSSFALFPFTSQKFLAVSDGDGRFDVPYMRAAEMYLIEAEARLGQSDAASNTF
jgi:hypothetical protein